MHTVELLLLAALVVAEAVIVLAAALVALVLTAVHEKSSAPAPQTPEPLPALDSSAAALVHEKSSAPPLLHPLAVMAEQLEALPVTTLRPMANVRSKRPRKAELVAAMVAC